VLTYYKQGYRRERSSIVGVVMSTVHVNLHYMLKQIKITFVLSKKPFGKQDCNNMYKKTFKRIKMNNNKLVTKTYNNPSHIGQRTLNANQSVVKY